MFTLDADQQKKLIEWVEQLDPPLEAYAGATGGRFTYSFTPTSLGLITTVEDGLSGQKIDLTDYDW